MNNWVILGVQFSMALIAYSLIYFWYVHPRVSKMPFEKALLPMLLVNVFRFAGLTLLVSGQASTSIPIEALAEAAYGDLLSAVFALIAVIALRGKSSFAVPLIWIFTIVGLVDILNVGRIAVQVELFSYPIGGMWLILSWYLPTVTISHFYILYRLFNREPKVSLDSALNNVTA